MVGILLPPSVAGALVNFAALLAGKVPVNLNYTASNEVLESCARQCELETVVTSKAFLERVPLQVPGRMLLLEDIAANPRLRRSSWRCCSPGSAGRLARKASASRNPATLDDLATVIFSSGSTGDPKGVMLSHYNISSNIEQVAQTFMLDRRDRLLGVLPFFHSFGFTVTLWLPAALGVGVVYHPNPLDLTAIASWCAATASHFCWPLRRFCKPTCADASPRISAACNTWWWARRSCRNAWPWHSRIGSAFVRSRATAARNARRWSA